MFLTFNNTNFTLLNTHSLTSYVLFINHYNIFSTELEACAGLYGVQKLVLQNCCVLKQNLRMKF